jgi:hypothetical protein
MKKLMMLLSEVKRVQKCYSTPWSKVSLFNAIQIAVHTTADAIAAQMEEEEYRSKRSDEEFDSYFKG